MKDAIDAWFEADRARQASARDAKVFPPHRSDEPAGIPGWFHEPGVGLRGPSGQMGMQGTGPITIDTVEHHLPGSGIGVSPRLRKDALEGRGFVLRQGAPPGR
jgi:hypothetical protein